MSTAWQPTIDGLTVPTNPTGSRLASAATATLAALDAEGALGPEHALTVQLILDLARALDESLMSGKISVAMSQAVRQLLDAMATLPTIERDTGADVMAEFRRALAEA